MKLKVKMSLPIAIMTFVMLIFSTSQFLMLNNQEKRVSELKSRQIESLIYAEEVKLNVVQVQQFLTDISATRAQDGLDDGFDKAEQCAQSVYALIDKLRAINPQRTELNDLLTYFKPYYETGKAMAAKYVAEGPSRGNQLMGKFDATALTINGKVDELVGTIKNEVSLSVENTRTQTTIIKSIDAAIAVIFVLIFILAYRYITTSISHPIIRMTKIADTLSVGDVQSSESLMSADDRHRKDEIGSLVNAFSNLINTTKLQVDSIHALSAGKLTTKFFLRSENDLLNKGLNELTGHLNQLLGSIITTSDRVLSGSRLVSASSNVLSQGSTEQASAIEALTTNLQVVAAQTDNNASNAEDANDMACRAQQNASLSNSYMQDMLGAMDDINRSSYNIRKIIKLIDDIAFQTNILSLNAAVEAARAGQQGKGFAVVAEEVRTLAARSANAAKETADMIESSIKNVESGAIIAKKTAATLGNIVSDIDSVANLISTITSASREQSAGITHINGAISQISEIIQTTAATAQEGAATSAELLHQVDCLNENVGIFEIKPQD